MRDDSGQEDLDARLSERGRTTRREPAEDRRTAVAMKHARSVAWALGIIVGVAGIATLAERCFEVEAGAISAGIAACALWVAYRVASNWRRQLITERRLDAVLEYWTAVRLLKRQVGAFDEGAKRLKNNADGPAACSEVRDAQRDLDLRWQAFATANARVWPHDKEAEKHLRALEPLYEGVSAWCYDVLGTDAAPRTECEAAPPMAVALDREEARLRKLIRDDYQAGT